MHPRMPWIKGFRDRDGKVSKTSFFNIHLFLSLGIWLYACLSTHLCISRRAESGVKGARHTQPACTRPPSVMVRWFENNPDHSNRLPRRSRSWHSMLSKVFGICEGQQS